MKSPILLYHKIDRPTPDVKIRGAFTSPRRFARQMSYLKRQGFEFHTASDFVQHYIDHRRFPECGVCLTFDDGWKDNYTNAFPILKRLGIKATVFLVASCIGKVTDQVTADGEGQREHLSEADIVDMAAAGIEFGSHSLNHKLFDRIGPDEIETEVRTSKARIESLIQAECRIFAYPAGFYSAFAQDTLKRSGFIGAFSTIYGPADALDIYAINRTEILRRHGYPLQFAKQMKAVFNA